MGYLIQALLIESTHFPQVDGFSVPDTQFKMGAGSWYFSTLGLLQRMCVCHAATTRKFATVSTGTTSNLFFFRPGTTRAIPLPAAVINPGGPANVSVHPTYGSFHVEVTIDGRTIAMGRPSRCAALTTSSAQFFVKVYVFGCRLTKVGVAASAISSDAISRSFKSSLGSCLT
jgi:hypothetical protein